MCRQVKPSLIVTCRRTLNKFCYNECPRDGGARENYQGTTTTQRPSKIFQTKLEEGFKPERSPLRGCAKQKVRLRKHGRENFWFRQVEVKYEPPPESGEGGVTRVAMIGWKGVGRDALERDR
ncbi:hypothetical protein E2C01_065081 [Portunus trituberculatus]|uniref:Uncharacterized protein n=1 Tax=Portunus trituberculatus TaxID=210409 RepID=A0A5B7HDJ0_PORTR|nr:hypothetical protein [Portunus trituberculatus]